MSDRETPADKEVEWEQLGTQVPVGLKRRFKAACAAEDRQMREVVAELIERWLTQRTSDDDWSI